MISGCAPQSGELLYGWASLFYSDLVSYSAPNWWTIFVLDFVSQVRDAILMNVYLDVRNPGGPGFWNEGYMGKGREMKSSVYKQSETKVDGSCHS